ncbi:ABC transporter permease [Telmatospirillum siberiense]|nr:ABC transporter permease [Telmatospirillum siberiense]
MIASRKLGSPVKDGIAFFKESGYLSLTVGGAVFAAIVVTAAAARLLFPGDPTDMVTTPLLWPGQSGLFPLGTTSLGQDVAAGLVWGARASLQVGILAAAVGLLLGLVAGTLAGYCGGWIDAVLVRVIALFQTMPPFLLVVVIVAIDEPTLRTISLAIGLAGWPTVARLVRAQVRSLRQAEFVLAARCQGYGTTRIVLGEILPNALPPVIATVSVLVANAILMEAGLSFLDMGDPNIVSWGSMIGAARDTLRIDWYLAVLPGLAIALTVLSLNLVSDGLTEVLSPRRRAAP